MRKKLLSETFAGVAKGSEKLRLPRHTIGGEKGGKESLGLARRRKKSEKEIPADKVRTISLLF